MRRLNEEPLNQEALEDVEVARQAEDDNFLEPVVIDNVEENVNPIVSKTSSPVKKPKKKTKPYSEKGEFMLHEEFSNIPPSHKFSMEKQSWNLLKYVINHVTNLKQKAT